jgi:proteasome lid subunit RPN8/RPN11
VGIFDRFRKIPKGDNPTVAPDDRRARTKAAPARPAHARKVTKIEREVLDLIFASARSSHPHEFGAVLRAEGDTVTEILIVPTVQGDRHAIMHLQQLPVDRTAVGTVHSHPTPNAIPSDADQMLFRQFGHTHMIVGFPYNMHTWIAYDHDANVIRLSVV